ncbi:MAG: phospholipase D family protein [Actinomycetota bacterium]|nr:phospholipase D family protein [Actinomycetota bacterium]
MLEPDRRILLADVLRPPAGYRLDVAVGTSYSLDLQALLMAPLSFALLDWATDEAGSPDVVALLEAVRRNADRITLFCQAGQIALPREYRALLVYLEDCVVEVAPPDPTLLFHPKVWALKFAADDREPAYRLVVLTRNLTFDQAWDTVLTLEGAPAPAAQRPAVRQQNRPLRDFLATLPDLAVHPRQDVRAEQVRGLADELADVAFDLPDGIDGLAFHPLGAGRRPPPFGDRADRVLVVSPFLTEGALHRLTASGHGHVLVSRQESLDAVGARALQPFDQVFVLEPAASQELAVDDPSAPASDQAAPSVEEAAGEAPEVELSGLHAKLVVVERGSDVRVFTGSANATDAALGGNVEFLVELATRNWRHGIDRLLDAGSPDAPGLRDLLQPYRPRHDEPPEETPQEALQRLLDASRRRLATAQYTARLTEHGDGFLLELRGEEIAAAAHEVESVHCWPITLAAGHAVAPRLEAGGLHAVFGRISPQSVTAFFAFELRARHEHLTESVRFAINARLLGAPDDRREQVLTELLRTRGDVLRYLLLLLADDDTEGFTAALGATDAAAGARWEAPAREPALFESLVRALFTDPGRLDQVARLIDDLRRSSRGDELLPPGIGAVWEPIWQARERLEKGR